MGAARKAGKDSLWPPINQTQTPAHTPSTTRRDSVQYANKSKSCIQLADCSALTLLVATILADDAHNTIAPYDLAVAANTLD
jgi:hypothetical protein